MKTIALTSTVFVLTAAGALAQQSDIEFLRARADAHERKISELEKEVNRLKTYYADKKQAYYADKKHPKAVPVQATPTPMASASEYVVKKGDMLGRIAKRHNTTVAALKKTNGLTSDHIRIGQKLRIPGAEQKLAAVPPAPLSKQANPAQTASSHTVKSGETFYSIARQHKISVSGLMNANPKVNPKSIQVGQKLSLKASSVSALASRKSASRAVASKPKTLPKVKESAKVAEQIDPPKPKAKKTKDVVRNAPADRKSVSEPSKQSEAEIRTITVHKQITYGQFASQHGASTGQLNELNGLSLSKNTMLAIGSELYVPRD